jgi:hypothetical protein
VAHICNHCEDFEKPVTLENGISLKYPIYGSASELQIDLYLHHHCAEAWSRDFDIPLPSRPVSTHVHSRKATTIAKSV